MDGCDEMKWKSYYNSYIVPVDFYGTFEQRKIKPLRHGWFDGEKEGNTNM